MVAVERFSELIRPLLASSELELWDVESGHGVLRVLVDRPGGVDLDALAAITGAISCLLDDHPEAAPEGRFHLEVSSPGIERALRRPEHFRSQVGAVVSVKTAAPVDGSRRLRGILLAADDHGIQLRPEDGEAGSSAGPGDLSLRYEQIQQARTVLVWGPPPSATRGHNHRPARTGHRTVEPATAVQTVTPARSAATKDDQA